MAENMGKKFEGVIKTAFEKEPNVSVDRLHDQTTGYAGSKNICDFIVYKKPYEYYIECKSVHGNTLSIHSNDKTGKGEVYGNITKTQWEGLSEKSQIDGVVAGIICWWVDRDVTLFIPIQLLQKMRDSGGKSIRYDVIAANGYYTINIVGRKKRVFFDYDMDSFFHCVEKRKRGGAI